MTEHPIDQYTLLCNRCGYIIEGLYEDAKCPECGLEISKSLPRSRSGTPWQNRHQSIIALIKTWIITLTRPRVVINNMRFDETSGKSMSSHTPFVAVSIALIAFCPMMIVEQIWLIIAIQVIFGLLGLVYWLLVSIYFKIAAQRLIRATKKHGYKIDIPMAWSIVGHSSSVWILIPFGVTLSLWLSLVASHLRDRGLIGTASLLYKAAEFGSITCLLVCIPLSIGLSEVFIRRASQRLRYTNQSTRPLFSTDNQQLLPNPTRTNSPPKP